MSAVNKSLRERLCAIGKRFFRDAATLPPEQVDVFQRRYHRQDIFAEEMEVMREHLSECSHCAELFSHGGKECTVCGDLIGLDAAVRLVAALPTVLVHALCEEGLRNGKSN